MCMIETYHVIYPDGTRDPKERLLNCERGTPSQPCRDARHTLSFEERQATAAEIRAAEQARYPIVTPAEPERPRSYRQSRGKPKGLLSNIAKFLGVSTQTSSKKTSGHKSKRFFIRNRRKVPVPEGPPATVHYPPRAPTPPPYNPHPAPELPTMPRPPIIVPIEPPRARHTRLPEHHAREPERRPRGRQRRPHERERQDEPRRKTRRPAIVHQSSSEEDSPSSPKAYRRHQRKTRSLSPKSKYEEQKRAIQEMERREHAARVAREEQDAHDRAVQLEEDERREDRRRAERQRRIEFEERRRIESAERARRRQQQEDERNRVRDEARIHQEREDLERMEAAERLRHRQQQRDRAEEQERRDRLHRANIPRQPRHQPVVTGESLDERGQRFIRDAVRARENLRQFDRERTRPPVAYERYDGRSLWRRNTIDGGQRRRREHQRDPPWHSR